MSDINSRDRRSTVTHRRLTFATLLLLAFALSPINYCVDAFVHPPSTRTSLIPSRISSSLLLKRPNDVKRDSLDEDENNQFTLSDYLTRQFPSILAPLALSASLLFTPHQLLHTVQAIEPANAVAKVTTSPIATSIDIDLKGVPELTRKAIANRDALQKYLIESAKSFQPILELLSQSDTVTVTPPKDVKGAINSLLGGEAQFVVNKGDIVDVRVESVPGVVIVRIINPNIPRLPFLKDGSAAIKFVDQIVDVAPKELEKASEEVLAVEKFLTWGAPVKKEQVTFGGSQLGQFLSSKFELNGKKVNMGAFGDLTNSEVIIGSLTVAIGGVYAASYAFYVQLQEEAEKEAAEKKATVAAKKKARAKEQSKNEDTKAEAVQKVEISKPIMVDEALEAKPATVDNDSVEDGYTAIAAISKEETTTAKTPKKMRKRDAIKKLFGKGD